VPERLAGASAQLGLGTVQFGLDYGIASPGDRVQRIEIEHILARASAAEIRTLDTAAAYGESERVLGELLVRGAPFEIVTKTVPLRCSTVGDIEMARLCAGFTESLERLRRPAVHTLLVHHADDLLAPGGERIYEQLLEWRDAGLLARIGFSAYDERQIDSLVTRYDFDIVQLPVSVFDQRLVKNGTIAALHKEGVAIHARSVFLQGVVLMSQDQLPARLASLGPRLASYRSFLKKAGASPMEAALGFVCHLPGVEVTLIGVLSCKQLDECIAAYNVDNCVDLSCFSIDDPELVDPRRWVDR
jgi:aryl-alcohol dehydrogenase-like predicted oxidoreductase